MAPVFLPKVFLMAWPLSSLYSSSLWCPWGSTLRLLCPWSAVCLPDSTTAGEGSPPSTSPERLHVWFWERSGWGRGSGTPNLVFLEKCFPVVFCPSSWLCFVCWAGDYLHRMAWKRRNLTPPSSDASLAYTEFLESHLWFYCLLIFLIRGNPLASKCIRWY